MKGCNYQKMKDIILNYEKVSPEMVEKYKTIEEGASLNEAMPANGALDSGITPLWAGSRACGPAFTVQARPGDNLIIHRALRLLQPGDVLVVALDGFTESGGMFGGIMSSFAQKMGCAGLVIDGSVRDSMHMKEIGFPVFCRGRCVKSSTKRTPGKINHPVVIGNVVINAGDMVYADNDSVVIVPREIAEEVYEAAHAREEAEKQILIDIAERGEYDFTKYQAAYDALGLTEETRNG